MKINILLLISLMICEISVAQTKLHNNWSKEEQEQWVKSMKEKFPFDLTDLQIDSMILLHVEYRKTVFDRAVLSGEKSQKVQYHQKFYSVLTSYQRKVMEDYDNRKAEAKEQQEIWDDRNRQSYFSTRKEAKKMIQESLDPLIESQIDKLRDQLTIEEKEEIKKVLRDERLYLEVLNNTKTVGVKAFMESTFYDSTLSQAELQEKFNEFTKTKEYQKAENEFWSKDINRIARENNFAVFNRKKEIEEKHKSKISTLINEINPEREQLKKEVFELYDSHYRDAPLRKIDEEEFWRTREALMYSYIDNYRYISTYWKLLISSLN